MTMPTLHLQPIFLLLPLLALALSNRYKFVFIFFVFLKTRFHTNSFKSEWNCNTQSKRCSYTKRPRLRCCAGKTRKMKNKKKRFARKRIKIIITLTIIVFLLHACHLTLCTSQSIIFFPLFLSLFGAYIFFSLCRFFGAWGLKQEKSKHMRIDRTREPIIRCWSVAIEP